MSMASDNWMMEHAYDLARTGAYIGWQAIEREMRSEGFSRASLLLNDGHTREELNRVCARYRDTKGAISFLAASGSHS